jgi:hypothetical protein
VGIHRENEVKRPKSIKTRLLSLDQDIPEEEKPPMRSIGDEVRPPSRHKTPPKATGLELPPWPVTPPESDKLEMTWSHSMLEDEAESI